MTVFELREVIDGFDDDTVVATADIDSGLSLDILAWYYSEDSDGNRTLCLGRGHA
jgi:hypothetical protein